MSIKFLLRDYSGNQLMCISLCFYYPPIFWERGKYGIVIMSNERNTFKPVLIKRSPRLSGRGHLPRGPNDLFFIVFTVTRSYKMYHITVQQIHYNSKLKRAMQ